MKHLLLQLTILIHSIGFASAALVWTANEFDAAATKLQEYLLLGGDCDDDAIGKIMLGDDSANCPGFKDLLAHVEADNTWTRVQETLYTESQVTAPADEFFNFCNHEERFSDRTDGYDQYGCTIFVWDNTDSGIGTGKASEQLCLLDRVYRVVSLKLNFDITKFISTQCLAETTSLESTAAITAAYYQVESMNHSMYVSESDRALFLNYTDHTSVYQAACEGNDGIFRELSYRANCSAFDEDQLHMVNFPRCYSSSCSELDEEGLFKEFALGAASELHSYPTRNMYWSCEGDLFETTGENATDVTSEYCAIQNIYIEQNSAVIAAYDAITTTSSESGTFSSTYTLSALGLDNYRISCESAGGSYSEFSESIDCSRVRASINTLQESGTFQMSKIPICHGISCDPSLVSGKSFFEQFLVDEGTLQTSAEFVWTCQ